MAKLPDGLRREVVAELYRRLDDTCWEERTQPERSAAYARFVDDPAIGGRLELYLPPDRVRVWIKDGPAKEYRRALEGIGPYASYTTRRAAGAEWIVRTVLGPQWTVAPKSVVEKPMRCFAERSGGKRLVAWGPESSLKDVFWHVAVHVAQAESCPAVMVLTKRGNAPIDATVWRRAVGLAKVVGCDVKQVSLAMTTKAPE